MALIKCPKCGEEISDKAEFCPNCKIKLVKKVQEKCPECGTVISETDKACPKCGCPITRKNKTNNKKLIVIIVLIIVLIAGAIVGVVAMKNKQEKEKNQEAARQVEEYGENLQKACETMLQSSADAEEFCLLVSDVWYNSINQIKDDRTNLYTRYSTPNGFFYDDFNDAINSLFSKEESTVNELKDTKSSVGELMKQLSNPPEEYKQAYDDLKELYDAYLALVNHAVSPQGSYNEYTDTYNELDTEVVKKYETMKIYLE